MASIRAGFIGLGNLGMPMAKSILRKKIPLTVYDLRRELVEEMRALGAIAANSPKEVAAVSDVIISMVNDIADTDAVVFGKDGVWDGINKDSIIVITSTIGPSYCQNLYGKAKERGIGVIDAPVSKSGPSNEEGQLTLMIGGDQDDVARCRPIFEALAKHPFHLGGIGTGQAYKLVNNLLSGATIDATHECLDLGLRAGLDPEKMIEVMQVSTGSNWYLRRLDNQIKLSRAHSAATRQPTKNIASKDWKLALELAEKVGARLPLGRFTHELDAKSAYDKFYAWMNGKGVNS